MKTVKKIAPKARTKIVCTLGPASDSLAEITDLISAGMDVARLNFSHGTYDHHEKILKNLQAACQKTGSHIGILQDLQGPKVRVGKILFGKIKLKTGKRFTLPLDYAFWKKDCKKGDIFLINDGLVEAEIISDKGKWPKCLAKNNGEIKQGNGVNLITNSFSLPSLTKKDLRDLKFGLKYDVDFIALSFVKDENDLKKLRKIIAKSKKNTKIIAKIERHEAVKNLEKIIKNSDAVMIARGDLGVDIPAAQVPIIQKKIIGLCRKLGKPVITATQVLQSMIKNPRATRAEISDAANAIYDGTDAIMLSNESAIGQYPTDSVKTLNDVALAVEKEIYPIAKQTIQIKTENSEEVIKISQKRPAKNILVITSKEKTARELSLVWGINQIEICES